MAVEDAIRTEAEQNEYARVLAARIGAEIAKKVDAAGFLDATDDEIEALAGAALAVIVAELGDETVASALEAAKELGLPAPTEKEIEAAMAAAVTAALAGLTAALLARRNILAGVIVGPFSAGTERIVDGAIAKIIAEAGSTLASNLAGELNTAAATGEGLATLFGAAGGDGALVRWQTVQDDDVCFDEDAADEETPSGVPLTDGAAGSCLARHGMALSMDDWKAIGLPKDPRLLCSRFRTRNCRCRLGTRGSEKPVNTREDRQRGRQRGEKEPIDAGHVTLDGLPELGGTGALTPPGWVHIRVTMRKARPTP